MLEFRILGPLEVSEGSRRCLLGGPRERALLAYLVLHANEIVASDRIIDDLWGEEPPRTVASMLHVYVSRLRKVVNQNGDGARGLFTQSPGYVLRIDDEQLDLRRFESLAEAGRQLRASGDLETAAEKLRAALAVWRGTPLTDLAYQPWAQSEIARLEESRLATLEERIDADLELGRHNELAPELQRLVAEHPLRERLVAQLMLALYRSGRQGEALTAYENARRLLSRDLGLEPGTGLKRLQRAILDQDPKLELDSGRRSVVTATPRSSRSRWALASAAVLVGVGAAFAGAVFLRQADSARRALTKAPPESVAVIDLHSNQLVDAVPVGGRMSGIAGGDGSVWVGDFDGHALLRIDPARAKIIETIALPDEPTDVAVGSRAIWVSITNRNLLARIDPRYGRIDRRIHLHQRAFTQGLSHFAAITVGPAGLWAGHNVSALTRLDPVRGTAVKQLTLDAPVTDIAEGGGDVWAVTGGTSHLLLVNPIQNTIDASTPLGGFGGGVAFGDGAVWTTDYQDDDVWRIDPSTRRPTAIVHVGNGPRGVAFGAGSVWVANALSGTVSRIDPHTARVVATIRLGNNPQELAVTDGRVWVTVP